MDGTGTRKGLKAQALVEFAFCLPILALMLFALVDGASYFRAAMCVRTAATEAAVYYAKRPDASAADIKAHVQSCVNGTEGDAFELDVSDAGNTETDYTMHVQQSDGWKTADAKTTTTKKKFTCRKTIKTLLTSLFGGGHTATAEASAVGSSAKEGELR